MDITTGSKPVGRKFLLTLLNTATHTWKFEEVSNPPMIEPKPGEREFYIVIPPDTATPPTIKEIH